MYSHLHFSANCEDTFFFFFFEGCVAASAAAQCKLISWLHPNKYKSFTFQRLNRFFIYLFFGLIFFSFFSASYKSIKSQQRLFASN